MRVDHSRPGAAIGYGAGPPQGLELRHLRYFVALADAGSFTRAAEQIFIGTCHPGMPFPRR